MPRRKYGGDVLRQKALELRARGLSYREIARELGCSVFEVHQLISPYESPRSRIRWVHELTTRVEELSSKLRDLEVLASRLESTVKPPAFNIGVDLQLLCRNVMEARMTYRPCKCMDSDGYCTRHFVFATESLKSIDCRRGVIRGVVDVEVCYPSVLTH